MKEPMILLAVNLCIGTMLWGAGIVFLIPLNRKNKFPLRLILCWILSCVSAAIMIPTYINGVGSGLKEYCVFYIFLAFMFLFCARIKFNAAIYCSTWSFVTFELAYELWTLLTLHGTTQMANYKWGWFINLWIFVLIYSALMLTIARFMPEKGEYRVGPKQLSSAILLVFVFLLLAEMLFEYRAFSNISINWYIVVCGQVYCVTVLYLQNVLFKKSAMKEQMKTMDLLWHQQKAQYELTKENISLINLKCHDLKHQMAAVRMMMNNDVAEKYLGDLEQSIRIYDSIVKTDNDVLDTILTEKSLYCEAHQIKINCVVDGRQLDFMDPIDLYTIFGNSIDNAIESVYQFTEKEKRIIDVLVYAKQQFLVINISNPLRQMPKFEDGMPITTKPKNGYHGYGIKSIKHTLHKYHGSVQVDIEDECFFLKIIIPI